MENGPFTYLASYLTKIQEKTFSRDLPRAMYGLMVRKCLLVPPSQMPCQLLCDRHQISGGSQSPGPITCNANATFEVERLCCFKKSLSSESRVTFSVVVSSGLFGLWVTSSTHIYKIADQGKWSISCDKTERKELEQTLSREHQWITFWSTKTESNTSSTFSRHGRLLSF